MIEKKRKVGRPPTKNKHKLNAGRPTKITEETIQKLYEGFSKGLNDLQCCVYAGISKNTLYNIQNEIEGFKDRKEALKAATGMQAVLNLHDEINRQNIDVSKWYLERRCKEEYSLKNESAINVSIDGLQDKEKALSDYMKGFLNMPE